MIQRYKVGTCSNCGGKDRQLIAGLCVDGAPWCYTTKQKERYLEKQKAKQGLGKIVAQATVKNSDMYPVFNSALKSTRQHIKKVSDKMLKQLAVFRKERDQYMEDHPICEHPDCFLPSTELHHGAGRIGSLLTDQRYFKALCNGHHVWAELHPIEAKEIGLSFTRIDK